MIPSLQSDRHQGQVRSIVDRTLAHERDGDRDVEPAGERPELGSRVSSQDSVAGQDERPLGGGDQVGGVRDRLIGRLGKVGPTWHERPRVVGDGRGGEVLRQLDVSRARLLEGRDTEGLPDDLRDRLDPFDMGVPLGDGLDHPDDVDDLMGLLVELVRARLAGDRDHRGAVEVGVRDAGHEVRRARAERRHRDRRATRQAAVDVGHEGRALLVARRDVSWRVALVLRRRPQGVEDVHRLLTGDGEDILTFFGGEALDQELGCGSNGRRHAAERSSRGGRARAATPVDEDGVSPACTPSPAVSGPGSLPAARRRPRSRMRRTAPRCPARSARRAGVRRRRRSRSRRRRSRPMSP